MADTPTRAQALHHLVVVLFENRSLDNVLGRLYGPDDGKTFEGVLGKELTNPIPEWAEHGADQRVVPYTIATDMDSPNPDSGEEFFHTNTQLFNTLDEHKRSKIGAGASERECPPPGSTPPWAGFVPATSPLSPGKWDASPPTRVRPIMCGQTLARKLPAHRPRPLDFGVFDHWFSRSPPRPMNLSNWDRGHASGLVVNSPGHEVDDPENRDPLAPQAHEDLEGLTSASRCPLLTRCQHFPRLQASHWPTHFLPSAKYEKEPPRHVASISHSSTGHDSEHERLPPRPEPSMIGTTPTSVSTLRHRMLRDRGVPKTLTADTVHDFTLGHSMLEHRLLIGWDGPVGAP